MFPIFIPAQPVDPTLPAWVQVSILVIYGIDSLSFSALGYAWRSEKIPSIGFYDPRRSSRVDQTAPPLSPGGADTFDDPAPEKALPCRVAAFQYPPTTSRIGSQPEMGK